MKGFLVRIGIDSTYGKWNAPCDPKSGEFLYVSIPENQTFRKGFERYYDEVIPYIRKFAEMQGIDIQSLRFPLSLIGTKLHLDPDFEYLTYGDNGLKRGKRLRELDPGDFIAFYASLKPVNLYPEKFMYALVGFYEIAQIQKANEIPENELHINAHTRKQKIFEEDLIVRAKPGVSGRLTKCIPIGKLRNRVYRVKQNLLNEWGGLSAKDGFIQRNNPYPWFTDPERFITWLKKQHVELVQRNNNV